MIYPEYITSENNLSKHSLQVDGIWLEMVLPYFRVIGVSGLNPMTPSYDVQDYTTDGGDLTSYRYSTRTITVTVVQDIEDYYTAISNIEALINKLKADGSTLKLIFNDDITTYYEGFYAGYEQAADTSWNGEKYTLLGTLTFICPYPHRRSIVDKTFTMALPSEDSDHQEVEIENNGTLPAPVNFLIQTPEANLAYVTLIGQEQIYEIGNSSDSETTYSSSTTVLTLDDLAAAENSTENYLWNHLNLRSSYFHTGTWGRHVLNKHNALYIEDSGISSATVDGRYGNCKEAALSEAVGNFCLEGDLWIQESKYYEEGYLGFSLLDADNNIVSGVEIYDGGFGGKGKIRLKWYVNNELVGTYETYKAGDSNSPFNWDNGFFSVKRESLTKFSLYFGRGKNGKWYSAIDTSVKDKVITKVQIFSYQYRGGGKATDFWKRRDFEEFKIYKLAGSSSQIADRFKMGDEIDINVEDSTISVNSSRRNDVEVVGSRIIMAPPGKSTVRAYYKKSPDTAAAPTVTARITERWY